MPFHENSKESDFTMYIPRKGTSVVRILPTWKPNGDFFKQTKEHYLKVNGNSYFISCGSLDLEPCQICDEMEKLNEANPELAASIRPTVKFLYNALVYRAPVDDRLGDVDKNRVYILKLGSKAHKQVKAFDRDRSLGVFDITSPKHGVALTIKREGTGMMDTTYMVVPAAGRTPLSEDLSKYEITLSEEDIASNLHNLDEQKSKFSEEEVAKVLKAFTRNSLGSFDKDFDAIAEPAVAEETSTVWHSKSEPKKPQKLAVPPVPKNE